MGYTLNRLVEHIEALPLSDIAQALMSAARGVDSLVSSPEVYGAIDQFDVTIKQTKALLEEINGQIEPLAANVAEVTEAMSEAIAAADSLMVSLRIVTTENQSDLYTSVKEMRETARALRHLLEYLQRHPDAVIWGKD